MPEFRLSCYALVRNGSGSVLLLQRAKGVRTFAGQWELPGGKVNAGEGLEAAVKREVREEAGIDVRVEALAGSVDFAVADFRVVMLVFEAASAGGQVQLSAEHQAGRWVPVEDVGGMELTEPFGRFWAGYAGKAGGADLHGG